MMQELDDDCKSRIFNKYLYAAAICLRTSATQFRAMTSISTLEPITCRKSETAIPRTIDGSRIGKTIRDRDTLPYNKHLINRAQSGCMRES